MLGRGESLRKSVLFLSIVFLLLINAINAGDGDSGKVDEKVIEELQNDDKVSVIVVLKEEIHKDFGIMNLGYNVDSQAVI